MKSLANISIDLDALAHNYQIVKQLAPNSKILAMIKANAYGHGLVRVAKGLNHPDGFGVARLQEASELRENGIVQPIVLMAGIFQQDEFEIACQLECDLMLHEHWQIDALKRAEIKKPLRIWLKINTGMNRLGFSPSDVPAVYSELAKLKQVEKPIILTTHFSDADDPQNPKTLNQLKRFNEITKNLDGLKSLANSAAIIAFPETHFDWVRPGIMLYGASPLKGKTGELHQLKPAMTVSSEIMAIREQQKGDEIGYGSEYVCSKALRVATIAIGYGDGYPRHAKTGTPVLINGKQCSVLARVSMDMIAVDISKSPNAKIGDEVILWGKGLPAESVAEKSETIAYELFCHISPRYTRGV